MLNETMLEEMTAHLGGRARLAEIGAAEFYADKSHMGFALGRPNRRGVRSVLISTHADGLFGMKCFDAVSPDTLGARLVASASMILPENLATVLGQLAGIDDLHHRHF